MSHPLTLTLGKYLGKARKKKYSQIQQLGKQEYINICHDIQLSKMLF